MSPAALLLTPGDPLGVGPEVSCKALHALRAQGRCPPVVLVGAYEPVERAAQAIGLPVARVSMGEAYALAASQVVPVVEPRGDEPVEVSAIRVAVAELLAHRAGALVTGPVDKGSIAARGVPFVGHTELLGELCGARPLMAFVGGRFRVALVTTHLPLAKVPAAITAERIAFTLDTVDRALREQVGIPKPRLWVCGLNPHAGDGGLLGSEELEIIAPAVQAARARGLDVVGPVSAEAAFRHGDGERDLIVAMYHDQGLAPLKAVDSGRAVNWTVGLPILRTSVDHGTARDIAGQGIADPSSMLAAIAWARTLVERRARP